LQRFTWCVALVLLAAITVGAEEPTPPPATLEQAAPDMTLSVERLYGSFTFWRQTAEGYEAGFVEFAVDQTWTMVVHLDVDRDRYPDRITVTRGQYSVGKREDGAFGYWLEGEHLPRTFLGDVVIVGGHVKSFTWQGRSFTARTGDMPYFVMDQDTPLLAGDLTVNTTPVGAAVSVDGVRIPGRTPLVIKKLKAGAPLRIRVELTDHLPTEQVITLAQGENRTLTFELSRGGLGLHVESNPRVKVKLDGQWLGYTPLDQGGLAPGRHVLELVNEPLGIYRREEIDVPADRQWRRAYEFNGRLIIDVGRPCKIYRRDRLAGQTPFDQAVPVGAHVLTLVDEHGRKKRLLVDVPLDGTVRIDRPFDSLPDAD
jgi:hypothetical protein